jgi:hypothetical protein
LITYFIVRDQPGHWHNQSHLGALPERPERSTADTV